MVSQKVVIQNFSGLHLRPAGILCGMAGKFESEITFDFEESVDVNVKSILSVLTACVKSGDEIIAKKKRQRVNPGEMENITFDTAMVKDNNVVVEVVKEA